MAAPSPSSMFEPEVVAELRRQFDAADKDGSGELDATEACEHFARACDPDADASTVKKLADNLRNQLDSDRSGTISFNEYCFRFGRRYQQELKRRRTAPSSTSVPSSSASAASAESQAADELRREREALEQEREALKREREDMNWARSGASAPSTPSGPEAPQTLQPGARVLIQGLRGAAELNGRFATILRFDAAAARYVVDLGGAGGQKSLRPENLTLPASAGTSGATSSAGSAAGASAPQETPPTPLQAFSKKAKAGLKTGVAHVQVWLAGYETWQILLGAALIVLFIGAWFQVSTQQRYSRNSGSTLPRQNMPRDEYRHSDRRDAPRDDFRRDDDVPPYREDRERDFERESSRRPGGRQQRQYDSYDSHDNYDAYDHGGGGGGGMLSGMMDGNNQLWTMVVIGGLGWMCYKGIIPVHRMSWFQLYMLWNMISPMLLGGRGGGMGMGRGRRRGFGGGFGMF